MAQRSAAFNIIFGAKTDDLAKALKTVDGKLRKTAAQFNKMGRTLSVGLTAPLVAIGTTSAKTAINFEAAMSKVRAVSGATDAAFSSLSDNARKLGASTRYSASQVASLQLEFAKLGFTADEITGVTSATLNLAQASGSDLAQSAEVAGSTLRAFGLQVTETGRVTDVMAKVFSSSALDINTFQDSMKFVAPVAKSAGVSIEQASALLGVLANNGIKGSQAGTALRRILQEVAGTGMDFMEAMQLSAEQVINLADAKDEVGRSASSAFLVLKEGMKDVKGLTEELDHAEGAAAKMAAVMDDNTEGALKRMSSALEAAQISFGNALTPAIKTAAGAVEGLASSFAGLAPSIQTSIAVVASFASAIGPALMGLGQMTLGLKAAAPAMRALNLAIRANPLGMLITALGIAGSLLTGYASTTGTSTQAQRRFTEELRSTNLQLARQSGQLREAMNLQTEVATVSQLRDSLSSLQNALDNTNLNQAAAGLSFAPQFVKQIDEVLDAQGRITRSEKLVKLGENISIDLSHVPPLMQQELRGILREGIPMLSEFETDFQTGIQRALTPEEKEANKENAKRVARNLIESYLQGLGEKRDEIKKKLDELLNFDGANGGVTTTVSATVQFKTDPNALEEIFRRLSEEEGKIAGIFELDGNEITQSESLRDAYLEAAQALASIGELDTAKDFYETATAAGELADNLNRMADLATRSRDTINQLGYETGTTISSMTDLMNALTAFGTNTTDEKTKKMSAANEQYTQTAQAMGQALSSIISEAARGEKTFGDVVAAAGRQVLAALLSETIGLAIRNAFSSASATGPAAAIIGPALAATAVSTVTGLFRDIPALATGGITTGPMLSLIGDNPGGREVVMPLDRLRGMIGDVASQGRHSSQLSGRLSGRDIILSTERSGRYTARTMTTAR